MMNLSYDEIIDLTSVADIVTVDIEGVSRMLGFSVCFDGLQDGFYLPFTHIEDEGHHNLTPAQQEKIFATLRTREALVFHNAVHDLRGLARHGFDYRGKFYDTMLMQHWINEELRNYKLDNVSKVHGFEGKNMPPVMSFIIETEGWDNVPVGPMMIYGGTDAFITHGVFRKLLPQFQAEGFDGSLWATEQRFIRDVMGPMIDLGIKIDLEFCIREYLKGTAIMKDCKAELGMNPASNKDMQKLLIEELGLPVLAHTSSCVKCKKRMPVASHEGTPSFNKTAMEEYDLLLANKDDHRARTILRYRGWQKATSSNYKPYMDLCDSEAILHPGYKLHGTRTGRLSCEAPNLQQIPKSSDKEWNGLLDQAFVARDGFTLYKFDYSQLQFRMTCAYANQTDLLEIFNAVPERDIFTEMAKDLGWERQDVKTLVYLTLFGGGANRASVVFGITLAQGKALVEEFHSKYPGIRRVSNQAQHAASKLKYVEYWTGRRRHFFPGGAPTYRAFNAVIQGGEAEIMKRTMIRLQDEVCDDNCRMVLQIHDAIAFEIKDGLENDYLPRIQKVMEDSPKAFCDFVGVDVRFAVQCEPWKKEK